MYAMYDNKLNGYYFINNINNNEWHICDMGYYVTAF